MLKLTKTVGLSTVTSRVCLFADTYKLEVPKVNGGARVRFRATNLTNSYRGTNSFLSPMTRVITVTIMISAVLSRTWILAISYWSLNSGNLEFVTIIETVNWAYKGTSCGFVGHRKMRPLDRHQKSNTAADECTHFERSVPPEASGAMDVFTALLLHCNAIENRGLWKLFNLFLVGTNIQNYRSIVW